MEDRYAALRLENQLCFPLYACAKGIIKLYKPALDRLDLTYTQYVAMMALWEMGEASVKELGDRLFLDSGTLTPLLKKLERKGYLTRRRDGQDERVLRVALTEEGLALRERALGVPAYLGNRLRLEPAEAQALYKTLYKILARTA